VGTEPLDDSLADLAVTINHEHDLAYRSALDTLEHAIRCGQGLIEARAMIPDGRWGQWMKDNLNVSPHAATRYMRIATHADRLLTGDRQPKSINAAITYLRDIDAPAITTGRNGRRPTFDVDEAKRLRKLGMTYVDIGDAVGVSDVAVWRQLTPGATRRAITYTNRARTQRRAERRALIEKELTQRVARVGGAPADAYAFLRKCAIALDRALADADTDEMRRTLRDALAYTHRAEDAITRALGIERGRRHLG